MKKKLDLILLIDDDANDNFYHERIIKKAEVTESVLSVKSALSALKLLEAAENDPHQVLPDIIFLDINMPIMNGWEFLEAYKKFESPKFKELVIIMLTTSINPDDEEIASTYATVNGFIRKPLKRDKLNDIIEKHFKQLT